jgi:hypothetical protein
MSVSIKGAGQQIEIQIDQILSPENMSKITRTIALSLGGQIRQRVHERGQATDGGAIGTYSKEYMKKRIKRNRGTSTKVILSFDRQMEDDITGAKDNPNPTKIEKGWGVGYKNSLNMDKAQWAEIHFQKRIWGLTSEEITSVELITRDFVARIK